MEGVSMTEDGDYPDDNEIQRIKDWPLEDVMGLIEFVKSIWHWRDYAERNGNKFELHTGGWSGNEEIIEALMDTMFWSMCWESSRRGGHYYFEIPGYFLAKALEKKDGLNGR